MHYAPILTDKIAFTCHNRTPRLDQFFGFEIKNGDFNTIWLPAYTTDNREVINKITMTELERA